MIQSACMGIGELGTLHFITHTLSISPCSVLHQLVMLLVSGTDGRFWTFRCPISTPGKKECLFGDNCKFERDLHGLDLNIVRTTMIGKK